MMKQLLRKMGQWSSEITLDTKDKTKKVLLGLKSFGSRVSIFSIVFIVALVFTMAYSSYVIFASDPTPATEVEYTRWVTTAGQYTPSEHGFVYYGSFPQSFADGTEGLPNWDWSNDGQIYTAPDGNRYLYELRTSSDTSSGHWFKFEPIKWQILDYDATTNQIEIMTESVIESRSWDTQSIDSSNAVKILWDGSTPDGTNPNTDAPTGKKAYPAIRLYLNSYDSVNKGNDGKIPKLYQYNLSDSGDNTLRYSSLTYTENQFKNADDKFYNKGFLEKAFTNTERNEIVPDVNEYLAWGINNNYDGKKENLKNDANEYVDKVRLLSMYETYNCTSPKITVASTKYGFKIGQFSGTSDGSPDIDTNRLGFVTDYGSHKYGLNLSSSASPATIKDTTRKSVIWFTLTWMSIAKSVQTINSDGAIGDLNAGDAYYGIRPVMTLDLSNLLVKSGTGSLDDPYLLKANNGDILYSDDDATYYKKGYITSNEVEHFESSDVTSYDLSVSENGSVMAYIYSDGMMIFDGEGEVKNFGYTTPWIESKKINDVTKIVMSNNGFKPDGKMDNYFSPTSYVKKDEASSNTDLTDDDYSSIITIDLNKIDTSKVTGVKELFKNASTLHEIKNLDKLNTSQITCFDSMFEYAFCRSDDKTKAQLDLTKFDVSKGTSFNKMFDSCQASKIDMTGWELNQEVADSSITFNKFTYACNATEGFIVSGWKNTEKINPDEMFTYLYKASSLDFSSFKFKSNSDTLFGQGVTGSLYPNSLNTIIVPTDAFNGKIKLYENEEAWFACNENGEKVQTSPLMYMPSKLDANGDGDYKDDGDIYQVRKFDNPLHEGKSPLDSTKTVKYYKTKTNDSSITLEKYDSNGDGIDDTNCVWDISLNGDGKAKAYLFTDGLLVLDGTGKLKTNSSGNVDLPWKDKRSSITKIVMSNNGFKPEGSLNCLFSMDGVNEEDQKLTCIDLTNFDTSKAEQFDKLFINACKVSSENFIGIENLDTSKLTTMQNAFKNCKSLESIDLSNWNTSKLKWITYAFYGCENLTTADLSWDDTSNLDTMSNLFEGCKNLKTVNFGENFNTSKITIFDSIFKNCNALGGETGELDLSFFKFDSATSAKNMFDGCKNLKKITLNMDSEKTILTSKMFNACSNLEEVILKSNSNVPTISSTGDMFTNATKLKKIDFSGVKIQRSLYGTLLSINSLSDLEEVKLPLDITEGEVIALPVDASFIWKGDDGLTYTNLPKKTESLTKVSRVSSTIAVGSKTYNINHAKYTWDISSDGNGGVMAYYFDSLKGYDNELVIYTNDLNAKVILFDEFWSEDYGYDTTNYETLLNGSRSFVDFEGDLNDNEKYNAPITINPWSILNTADSDNKIKKIVIANSTKILDGCGLFAYLDQLEGIDGLDKLDTSAAEDMSSMFEECPKLTSLDVSNFVTTNVTTMECMFNGCLGLTSLNVSSFNTSSVLDFGAMFSNCSSLATLDVSNFVTASADSMSQMFEGCSSLTALDVSNFNTLNVTSMNAMFKDCSALAGLDLSNFNTVNVKGFEEMFEGCTSLSSIDISSFNTTNAQRMYNMFKNCINLTSLNLSSFTIKSGCNASDMLAYACTFDEYLSLKSIPRNVFDSMPSSSRQAIINEWKAYSGFTDTSGRVITKLNEIILPASIDSSITIDLPVIPDGYWKGNDGNKYTVLPKKNGEALTKVNLISTIFDLGPNRYDLKDALYSWDISDDGNEAVVAYYFDGNTNKDDNATSRTYDDELVIYSYSGDAKVLKFTTALNKNEDGELIGDGNIIPDAIPSDADWENYLDGRAFCNPSGKDVIYTPWSILNAFSTDHKVKTVSVANETNLISGHLLLAFLDRLVNVNGLDKFEFEDLASPSGFTNTTNSMFIGDTSLQSIDLSDFDMSCITNAMSMFAGCTSLKTVKLPTSTNLKLTNAARLFEGCINLENVNNESGTNGLCDLSSFDLSQVETLGYLFKDCFKIKTVNFGDNTLSSVNDMSYMFFGCRDLTEVKFGDNIDTSNLEDISFMFAGCSSLEKIDLSKFDASSLENANYAFAPMSIEVYCLYSMGKTYDEAAEYSPDDIPVLQASYEKAYGSLPKTTILNEVKFGDKFVTVSSNNLYTYGMFYNADKLESLDLSGFNFSDASRAGDMLKGCTGLIEIILPEDISASIEIALPSSDGNVWIGYDKDGKSLETTFTNLPKREGEDSGKLYKVKLESSTLFTIDGEEFFRSDLKGEWDISKEQNGSIKAYFFKDDLDDTKYNGGTIVFDQKELRYDSDEDGEIDEDDNYNVIKYYSYFGYVPYFDLKNDKSIKNLKCNNMIYIDHQSLSNLFYSMYLKELDLSMFTCIDNDKMSWSCDVGDRFKTLEKVKFNLNRLGNDPTDNVLLYNAFSDNGDTWCAYNNIVYDFTGQTIYSFYDDFYGDYSNNYNDSYVAWFDSLSELTVPKKILVPDKFENFKRLENVVAINGRPILYEVWNDNNTPGDESDDTFLGYSIYFLDKAHTFDSFTSEVSYLVPRMDMSMYAYYIAKCDDDLMNEINNASLDDVVKQEMDSNLIDKCFGKYFWFLQDSEFEYDWLVEEEHLSRDDLKEMYGDKYLEFKDYFIDEDSLKDDDGNLKIKLITFFEYACNYYDCSELFINMMKYMKEELIKDNGSKVMNLNERCDLSNENNDFYKIKKYMNDFIKASFNPTISEIGVLNYLDILKIEITNEATKIFNGIDEKLYTLIKYEKSNSSDKETITGINEYSEELKKPGTFVFEIIPRMLSYLKDLLFDGEFVTFDPDNDEFDYKKLEVEVNKLDLSDTNTKVVVSEIGTQVLADPPAQIKPSFTVTYTNNVGDDIVLAEGTDYTVTYGANNAAGVGTVTITGNGTTTTGQRTINFTIKDSFVRLKLSDLTLGTYEGVDEANIIRYKDGTRSSQASDITSFNDASNKLHPYIVYNDGTSDYKVYLNYTNAYLSDDTASHNPIYSALENSNTTVKTKRNIYFEGLSVNETDKELYRLYEDDLTTKVTSENSNNKYLLTGVTYFLDNVKPKVISLSPTSTTYGANIPIEFAMVFSEELDLDAFDTKYKNLVSITYKAGSYTGTVYLDSHEFDNTSGEHRTKLIFKGTTPNISEEGQFSITDITFSNTGEKLKDKAGNELDTSSFTKSIYEDNFKNVLINTEGFVIKISATNESEESLTDKQVIDRDKVIFTIDLNGITLDPVKGYTDETILDKFKLNIKNNIESQIDNNKVVTLGDIFREKDKQLNDKNYPFANVEVLTSKSKYKLTVDLSKLDASGKHFIEKDDIKGYNVKVEIEKGSLETNIQKNVKSSFEVNIKKLMGANSLTINLERPAEPGAPGDPDKLIIPLHFDKGKKKLVDDAGNVVKFQNGDKIVIEGDPDTKITYKKDGTEDEVTAKLEIPITLSDGDTKYEEIGAFKDGVSINPNDLFEISINLVKLIISKEGPDGGVVTPLGTFDIDASSIEINVTVNEDFKAEIYEGNTLVKTLTESGKHLVENLKNLISDLTVKIKFVSTKKPDPTPSGGGGGGSTSSGPIYIVVQEEDLKNTHKAYMNGYGDKTFKPQEKVTREEVATIVARLDTEFNEDYNFTSYNDFSDSNDKWSKNYIGFCKMKELIHGYEDGSYRPSSNMTRAELATLVNNFLRVQNADYSSADLNSPAFKDIDGRWYEEAVNKLAHLGILNGYEDGTFRGDQPVTRIEVAIVMNKINGRTISGEVPEEYSNKVTSMFKDISPNRWFFKDVVEASINHPKDLF